MPGPGWETSNNPLLSGLFGVLQSASAGRASTAETWSALRRAAGTWQAQTSGTGEMPDDATLEANGAEVLRSQGVGIQEVNRYRAVANDWRTARQRLHRAGTADQVRGDAIFTPPWAKSGTDAVPSRYRVKVAWNVQPLTGDPFTVWGSYELDAPVTSIEDILGDAGQLAGKKPTSAIPLGGTITGAADYELEQI